MIEPEVPAVITADMFRLIALGIDLDALFAGEFTDEEIAEMLKEADRTFRPREQNA